MHLNVPNVTSKESERESFQPAGSHELGHDWTDRRSTLDGHHVGGPIRDQRRSRCDAPSCLPSFTDTRDGGHSSA
jgi:hypothetical protein